MKTVIEEAKPFIDKIVAFVPRGQDVELRGKVIGGYMSDLDDKTYLKIKAEDGKTYTKQIKYVEVLKEATMETPVNDIPEGLMRELKALSGNTTRTKETEAIVKKMLKKELRKMIQAIK